MRRLRRRRGPQGEAYGATLSLLRHGASERLPYDSYFFAAAAAVKRTAAAMTAIRMVCILVVSRRIQAIGYPTYNPASSTR